MTPFLELVARTYLELERDSLVDYCFVFPNKRSGVFFNDYIRRGSDGLLLLPEITTIDDFVKSLSPCLEATRYDMLFTLYNEYSKLSKDITDFDRFIFWGEMLINDFNDVDRYLVDPDQLFINVKRLKEIQSNYFTPEQIEVIRRYWGEFPAGYNPDEFWRHLGVDRESEEGNKFMKLWEVLQPLYHNFHDVLASKNLASPGGFYRRAAETMKTLSPDDLPSRRYIFVGFNVLSASEQAIFSRLKALDMADFYWDFNSPTLRSGENKAGRYILRHIEAYPSRYDLDEPEITDLPDIRIIGIPSQTGQVKKAGEIVRQWGEDGTIRDRSNAVDTAIVLPDEQVFIPLVHSIPTEIESINVTMGYPMRNTDISALMSGVVSMHLRARKVRGAFQYYYEDLQQVLSHPIIQSISGREANDLLEFIQKRRLFTADLSQIMEFVPKLRPIFAEVEDLMDFNQVYDYARGMVGFLLSQFEESDQKLEYYFLQGYHAALEQLKEAADSYNVTMKENTFFHLIERALSSATVNFTGEPLRGLQIMGVLETRALDFDNIIMLSMNERVFPRRHTRKSFIPEALRSAFGLSAGDIQESISAYYFFRLLSRAKKVVLIYDARRGAGRSGEMSRFLGQLLYIYGSGKIPHGLSLYRQFATTHPDLKIEKTPAVMKKLLEFTRDGSGRALSASSINEYINCPLNFYLRFVENYNPRNEITDFMDASTYGTILHLVAERLYEDYLDPADPGRGAVITDRILDRILDSPVRVEQLITYAINDKFLQLGADNPTPLKGENELLGKAMKIFILAMLRAEKEFTPFRFMAGEQRIVARMEINDSLTINIKQFIDRVDCVKIDSDESRLRVVDYKTGIDELSAKSVDQMFDTSGKSRPKALLQLFFYCNAYSGFKEDKAIQPVIYKFSDIVVNGVQPIEIADAPVLDYREYNAEFLELFKEVIEEMFDPEVPFVQAETLKACKFCRFREICKREEGD